MTKDEALDLALEALSTALLVVEDDMLADEIQQAITAIKQARSAPVQEPVAWGIIASNTGRICQVELDADEIEGHNSKHIVPLYTTPPAAPVQPIIGSYLEKDNSQFKFSDYESDGMHHNKPAVPDVFGTREGEHPQYIQGWDDCRSEMLKGMKP